MVYFDFTTQLPRTNMDSLELSNLSITCGLVVLMAYFVGSISPGYVLVSILRDIDVRNTGSGTVGARNVGRILGQKGFYITLLADVLKGAVTVWLAVFLECPLSIVNAAVVAVIAGHVWPIWLGFRGGKGIATGLGAFAILDFKILLMGGMLALVLYMVTRNFMIGWIISIVAMPIITLLLGFSWFIVISLFLSSAIILYAHKNNINEYKKRP